MIALGCFVVSLVVLIVGFSIVVDLSWRLIGCGSLVSSFSLVFNLLLSLSLRLIDGLILWGLDQCIVRSLILILILQGCLIILVDRLLLIVSCCLILTYSLIRVGAFSGLGLVGSRLCGLKFFSGDRFLCVLILNYLFRSCCVERI